MELSEIKRYVERMKIQLLIIIIGIIISSYVGTSTSIPILNSMGVAAGREAITSATLSQSPILIPLALIHYLAFIWIGWEGKTKHQYSLKQNAIAGGLAGLIEGITGYAISIFAFFLFADQYIMNQYAMIVVIFGLWSVISYTIGGAALCGACYYIAKALKK